MYASTGLEEGSGSFSRPLLSSKVEPQQNSERGFFCGSICASVFYLYEKWTAFNSIHEVECFFNLIPPVLGVYAGISYVQWSQSLPTCCNTVNYYILIVTAFSVMAIIFYVPMGIYAIIMCSPSFHNIIARSSNDDIWYYYSFMDLFAQLFMLVNLSMQAFINANPGIGNILTIIIAPTSLFTVIFKVKGLLDGSLPRVSPCQRVTHIIILLASIVFVWLNFNFAYESLKRTYANTSFTYSNVNYWVGNAAYTGGLSELDDDLYLTGNCSSLYYYTDTKTASSGAGGGTIDEYCTPYNSVNNTDVCCYWALDS